MKKLFKDALVYKDGKIHNMSAVFDGTEFSFFPGTGVSALILQKFTIIV